MSCLTFQKCFPKTRYVFFGALFQTKTLTSVDQGTPRDLGNDENQDSCMRWLLRASLELLKLDICRYYLCVFFRLQAKEPLVKVFSVLVGALWGLHLYFQMAHL